MRRRGLDGHTRINDRREFLQRFGLATAGLFVPSDLLSLPRFLTPADASAPFANTSLHLQPHYRKRSQLEAMLAKVPAGNDAFVTEKYHDQIAQVLNGWAAELLASPTGTRALEAAFQESFRGGTFVATGSKPVRSISTLQVSRLENAAVRALDAERFVASWRSEMSGLQKLTAAEFQVTGIHAASPGSQGEVAVQTEVRFEFVGEGAGYFREQRTGYWAIDWVLSSNGAVRIGGWNVVQEERARSLAPAFVDIAPHAFASAASFREQLTPGIDHWRTILDGACGIDIYGHNGVAVGDVDGDGFEDLYICQPAGLPNRLYRNRGDGTFEDITESSGTGLLENTACALFLDVSNSGRQDLVVVGAGGPSLFINDGGGRFREQPNAFQFATAPQGTFTGAAAADYDNDGWLDLYFCIYSYYQGADQYRYPTPYFAAENGPPNFLMRNQRDGTFRDDTREAGLNVNNTRFSFCCAWRPSESAGGPDLYVVNDFGRKNFYANDGAGHFRDVAREAGVEDVGAGMSVSCFDYDNDGMADLYVANMWSAAGMRISSQSIFREGEAEATRVLYRKHASGNSTFRNLGQGKFREETKASGLAVGRWSWSSDAWDFDQDGFPDVYIMNGMVTGKSHEDLNSFFWRQVVANSPRDSKPSTVYELGWNAINEQIRQDGTWSGRERNILYQNNRDGTFSEVSGALGVDFIEDARTFALGDFDHDGRVEVLVKNRSGPQLRLLKNVLPHVGATISFRLKGAKSNRDAIGAVVEVQTEAGKQSQYVQAGSGFLAQHSKELMFGLGEQHGAIHATVRWPSGVSQRLNDLPAQHRVLVREGESPTFVPFSTGAKAPEGGTRASSVSEIPETMEAWLLESVPAPRFSLLDASGERHALQDYRDAPVLIAFSVQDAPTSLENLEALQKGKSELDRVGLKILTLNVGTEDLGVTPGKRGPRPERAHAFPVLQASSEVCAVYNLLFRQLFDRHRDMPVPCSLLIDGGGSIVKVYIGQVDGTHVAKDADTIPHTRKERLSKALPFAGNAARYDFGRNYLSLGSVFYDRGYLEASEEFFQLAAKESPSSAEPRYGLGSVYLEQSKVEKARAAFETAVRLRADYPGTPARAWNNLGILDAREGHIEASVRNFQKALEIDPNYSIAIDNLGNAYRQAKDWDRAQSTFERALQLDGDDPEANYGLGMIHAQRNDTQGALTYLKRAIAARTDYPEALNNLGVVYVRLKNPGEAEDAFLGAIRIAPEFSQSYVNLARLYSLQGNFAKARGVLEQLLKKKPGDPEALQELSQLPQ